MIRPTSTVENQLKPSYLANHGKSSYGNSANTRFDFPSTSSTIEKSQVPLNMQRLKLALRCQMWGDWVVEWVNFEAFKYGKALLR